MLKLDNKNFVTGSKDKNVKRWNLDCLINNKIDNEHQVITQSDTWVTALCAGDNENWFCGFRNGDIYMHNNDFKISASYFNIFESKRCENRVCKLRNIDRVNCLYATKRFNNEVLYIGKPTEIIAYDLNTKTLSSTVVDQNDWVYCIDEINDEKLLVVIGARMEIWESHVDKLVLRNPSIVRSESKRNGSQRKFISAIKPLINDKYNYSLSIFGGYVEVFNLERKVTIFSSNEHSKRVWMCENVTPSVIASCADDGLIKLWDLRQAKSIKTVKDNQNMSARVSVLLKINDNTLISSSCPDEVAKCKEKAQFSFWDLRFLYSK